MAKSAVNFHASSIVNKLNNIRRTPRLLTLCEQIIYEGRLNKIDRTDRDCMNNFTLT